MHLNSLALVNFKNYKEATLELSPDINIFIGENGAGKTNVLDAVYYLAFCRSFLNPIDKQCIRIDEKFFLLQGSFVKEEKKIAITCSVKEGQKKKVTRNKKEYEKLADHIGEFPAVVISPYDRNLISEGSETRRKFIDSIISQFDRNYLETLIRYNKVLQQRNALLKQFQEMRIFDLESIDVWDLQLIDLGNVIHKKRSAFLLDFIPVFQKYFNLISNNKEEIDIHYKSQLIEEDFATLLRKSHRKDNALGYTNVGIHKDDLVFLIHQQPIKKFGSQGQQKSFLIALKLAQFELVSGLLKKKPILLLDDIFDKLDHLRVAHLMQLISDHIFGQVFISDTDRDRIEKVFDGIKIERKLFTVNQGNIEEG
ncbi:DNA replication/repair protein RecF [Crocinitomix algicola]|uniref:DNA replication/repair protein RecF n=1 Tax=Crocinitomix algicola TaxID=1740263 RepID=UPI00082C5EA9|nr:DNA replication/repair protein RecF [Crocinitomix algicola]